jgi:hypothetical protein
MLGRAFDRLHCRIGDMQPAPRSPLLTSKEIEQLFISRDERAASLECSMDLQLSTSIIEIGPTDWSWSGRRFPYPERFRDRTVYYWDEAEGVFQPAARFRSSLIKLVPTEWGAPTFEIDGIKMLPSERVSPYEDARSKVASIQPRGKIVLDTCGGLGYFGAWCVLGGAKHVRSFELDSGVLWLRSINPWSPAPSPALTLIQEDVTHAIVALAADSIDAILHDPPRFGIAGELYSLSFYGQLARVLKRRGLLFHYTGTPNKLTSGRDVPNEVAKRLHIAGFDTKKIGDGILAAKK